MVGRYYVINQGTDISSNIASPKIVYLNRDGSLAGEEIEGIWEMTDGTYYVHLTMGEQEFSGIFCQMKDEAGTDVMTFSAVGSNESMWGVKY